jgi:hypothetical protein
MGWTYIKESRWTRFRNGVRRFCVEMRFATIKRSPVDGGLFLVFRDSTGTEVSGWLFATLLGRHLSCFGGYENAWRLTSANPSRVKSVI